MERRELIELALTGSKGADGNEEASNIYVDIAEHLLTAGHATTITEIDQILQGMTVESAERLLASLSGEVLEEGKDEIAAGVEDDPEGYMTLRQIATAEDACNRIKAYIGGDKMLQLPGWVQAKMATAAADLDSIADYLVSDTPSVAQSEIKPKKK